MKEINTPNAPTAIGPYCQAMQTGNLIYLSGQLPLDPVTMEIVPGGVVEQTHQMFKNVKNILQAAGVSLENVVKTTVFVKDMNDFATVNQVYASYFGNHKPARICVQVARLPKDALVEMEVIAEAVNE